MTPNMISALDVSTLANLTVVIDQTGLVIIMSGFLKRTIVLLNLKIKLKTEIIELPCKVGDTVYYETFINGISQGIKPHKVIGFTLETITQNIDGFGCTPVPIRDFGKKVFLTHKEAEALLKDLKKKQK